MLPKELYRLSELDQQIAQLRKELAKLYSTRALIVDSRKAAKAHPIHVPVTPVSTVEVVAVDRWALAEYEKLQQIWHNYGAPLPKFAKLKDRLINAYRVMSDVSAIKPELRSKMSVLLVPPKKYFSFPVPGLMRSQQKFITHGDYIEANFPIYEADKDWRVLVAYSAINGIYLGNPLKMLGKTRYQIASYPTNAMGQLEYAALTLQHPHILDKGTSTVLLKDYDGTEQIPAARFSHGSYRFLFAHSTDGVFGDYRYRPTIEIPSKK